MQAGFRLVETGAGVCLAVLLTVLPSPVGAAACPAVDGVESICGLVAPEDMVLAPNGRDLIFGQMGEPGGLSLLDTRDDSIHPLFPGPQAMVAADPAWGDPACPPPADWIEAHGIDLRQRADGRWQLLVVNHQRREAVEFFELLQPRADRPVLVWRGCAEAPQEGNLNDVAGLPDGGFLVTHMADQDSQVWSLLLALLGFDSGYVYRWDAAGGFRPVPGTGGRFPNGIALAPDGRTFFVNEYFGSELRKYDLASGALLGRVAIDRPDNSSWTSDGHLLVASHLGGLLDILQSVEQPQGEVSYLPFAVVEVDPATLTRREILRREGPPLGAGTVAVQRGDFLYIGSYVGDRIIKVPRPGDS